MSLKDQILQEAQKDWVSFAELSHLDGFTSVPNADGLAALEHERTRLLQLPPSPRTKPTLAQVRSVLPMPKEDRP
jgi:hypothetical protein